MPLYEFRCPQCGEQFERLVRGARQTEPIPCSRCGWSPAERAFSTFATAGRGGCDPQPGGG
jgi:putative FmdB family regulatory protein